MGTCIGHRRAKFYNIKRMPSTWLLDLEPLKNVKTCYEKDKSKKPDCLALSYITIREPILMDPKSNPLYISHINKIKYIN
ncbi:hypothetical protein SteCoe_28473 [Stentor coeruleus]|uniref:Uncharacterized protein n=1 Tax=Stentor coeruleus TaxID=5963 RepID=A0A1R2B8G2_9CILI|nr:hypothetical protein SteCoe_28473 [Stentor coeruleus]